MLHIQGELCMTGYQTELLTFKKKYMGYGKFYITENN